MISHVGRYGNRRSISRAYIDLVGVLYTQSNLYTVEWPNYKYKPYEETFSVYQLLFLPFTVHGSDRQGIHPFP